MAFSLAHLVSFSFLSRSLLCPVRPVAASVSRAFSSSTVPRQDGDAPSLEYDCRSDRATHCPDNFLSDVFRRLSPTRSLIQVLHLMDQFMNHPFLSTSRRPSDVKESDDALHLQVYMPGLGKEDVKVSVKHNTLTIEGEGAKEGIYEESVRYSKQVWFTREVIQN